jgi:large subunit ribosomal protein L10
LEIEEMLVGPTAIAFIRRDSDGDPVLMAKALRDFAKTNPNLEVKGGLLNERPMTAEDIDALAKVAPREELLARLAYGLAAPMQQFASLLEALPRNFAYGLKALIDQGGGPDAPAPAAEEAPTAEPEVATDDAEAPAADEAPAEDTPTADEVPAEAASTDTETTDEAPADAVTDETEAPAEDDTAAEADDTAAEAATETDAPADEADADDPAADDAATTEES